MPGQLEDLQKNNRRENLEKIRLILIIGSFVLGIIFLIVPSIQEKNRENKISSGKIDAYIKNSTVLHIKNIEVIVEKRHITYADATLSYRYPKSKNILLLRDTITKKYYQIEVYDTRTDANQGGDIQKEVYLKVNTDDNKGKGTKENPILAFSYYINPQSQDYYIQDDIYRLGVREYLIYQDYKPVTKALSTVIGAICFILAVGIAVLSYLINRK